MRSAAQGYASPGAMALASGTSSGGGGVRPAQERSPLQDREHSQNCRGQQVHGQAARRAERGSSAWHIRASLELPKASCTVRLARAEANGYPFRLTADSRGLAKAQRLGPRPRQLGAQ